MRLGVGYELFRRKRGEEGSRWYGNVCQAEKPHFHLSPKEMVPTGGYL